MLDSQHLLTVQANQLCLKLSGELQQKSWRRSQCFSNATARSRAYLNTLCVQTLIPWLQAWLEEEQFAKATDAESPLQISIFKESSLPSIWEVVNGTTLCLGRTRLAIIPSETTDLEEIGFCQEWVDIPGWRADYLLAVQVNLEEPDASWMRAIGYITPQKLKRLGIYDESDRTYYVRREALDRDLEAMLLALIPGVAQAAGVESVPELSRVAANELVEKLGNSSIYLPRLAVTFEQWAALLANDRWRQKLYRQRLGLTRSLPCSGSKPLGKQKVMRADLVRQ